MAKLYRQPFAPKGRFRLNEYSVPAELCNLRKMPRILDAVEFLDDYGGSRYMRYALEKLKIVRKTYRHDREKILGLYGRMAEAFAERCRGQAMTAL